ncbi:uncharacterized protein LOC117609838 [Osmia lignaria lignaria]|uniref:uncharacterized protein LOC117609838 n=1 Tax=Osmia lignaria lignaria TaxID=1437193 RepID=UPI00147935D3|nr:uncharacterized protein LOC117609838 [Osmia lignaria]
MDISSMLEVQVDEVKELDVKENVTPRELLPSTTNVSAPISQEEYSFYKLMFGNDISAVRFKRLHCTACDAHIGSAVAESYNMCEHPVLHTLLCAKCRDFYGDGTFEQGDDATDMFCRWCANGGNLYCCSFCSNTFCYKCIRRNFDPILRKKIEADEKWKCFVCDPRDLYNARATCWALLQHIQTMNRLLQNNCNLTEKEIEEKMNLDETKCCPRRRKRKRRRTASNSEEEDKTYIPELMETTSITKRRRRGRGRGRFFNGNISIAERPHSKVSEGKFKPHAILPSLFSCEQTIVEGKNAIINTSGVISQHQTTSFLHKVKSTAVQHPTMYNTIMNVVTAPNFLHPTSSVVPISHVSGSINPMNQMNLYQAMPYTPVPMVTIPNQSVNILNRSHFSLPEVQTSLLKPRSNVIEIESDSDDVAVVGSSKSSSFKNNIDSNKAVPVALVSLKTIDTTKTLETSAKCIEKTLNQKLLPHGQEVDNILTNLRIELQDLFKASKRDELKKYELNEARVMIKQFHRKIRNAVTQLAYVNDRIVREYNKWKTQHLKTSFVHSTNSNNTPNVDKHEDIPLNMSCVNESDSDSDTEIQYDSMNPSEFIGTTNAVEEMQFFKNKTTVNKAIGNDSVSLVDKSIQIYDVELQDYDKCISHSKLNKIDQETEKQNSSSLSSREDKQLKSYEEHFIRFLQKSNAKVQGVQDSKKLPDPNETPLKDLIEANSPFISEMLETMDTSVVPSTSNLNTSVAKDSSSKSAAQPMNSITCKAVDDLVKMVSNMNDNLEEAKTIKKESIPVDELQKHSSDEICVENEMEKNEQNTSRSNCGIVEIESSNEDDCTIIDD